MRYYSVYDKVADDFSPVFPAKNDASAWRAFDLGYKQGKNIPGDFSDYELYFVFDLPETKKGLDWQPITDFSVNYKEEKE